MAKYDSLRKIKRNQLIRDFHRDNPESSFKEIGLMFNISESRAWRIVNGNRPRKKDSLSAKTG